MTGNTVYKFVSGRGSMLYAELGLERLEGGESGRTVGTACGIAGDDNVPVVSVWQFRSDHHLTMSDIVERVKRREMH